MIKVQLLRPITRDEVISVNQREFEVITCNCSQARENTRVQLAIGFGFASHLTEKETRGISIQTQN